MIASQSETHRVKRDECRGRLWLRSLARRPLSRLNQPPITTSISSHESEGFSSPGGRGVSPMEPSDRGILGMAVSARLSSFSAAPAGPCSGTSSGSGSS